MKTTLRITAAALCLTVNSIAQNPGHLINGSISTPHNRTQLVYNPSAERTSGDQDVQMVACTDKLTYVDRHNTTVSAEQIGGATYSQAEFQVYPDFTGTVTQAFATLARFSNNTTIRIGIFPLSGGQPTTSYIAYYDANVTSGSWVEYGGNLTGTANVTNGFAVGIFPSPNNPSDSALIGYRSDPDLRDLSYFLDYSTATVMSYYQSSFVPIDLEIRAKISFNPPVLSFSASPTSACTGAPITFSANPTTGIPPHFNGTTPEVYNNPLVNYTYAWDFGDAGTSTLAPPLNHTYSTAGTFTVIHTDNFPGWTTSCTTAPATATVTINGATPSVSIAASANPVCPNGTSNFTATPTNGGSGPSYVWKKNGVQVGTGSSYSGSSWTAGDVMTCEMVSNAPCAPSSPVVSNSIVMFMQPLSFSSYNYTATGLSVSFTSTAANAVSWAWNFGDAGTSSSATPVHNYTSGGTYTVDLIVTNACGQTNTSSINITVSSTTNTSGGNTGLHEKELQVNVNAFPNPVNNDLNVDYSINHPTDVTIEVMNTLGQVVATQSINAASIGTAHVSMENMATGLYFVRFTAGENNVQTMRIVHE